MKRQSKLITLILALALIVSAVVAVGVMASAEEAAPTLGRKNLYYWTDTSIGVEVNYTGSGTAGLLVYDSKDVTDLAAFDPAAATPIWENFKVDTYADVDFYLTQPIPANDMSYPYILVAAAKVGGEIVYGEKQFYSVTAYAYERLGEDSTEAQKKLYNNLIAYAEAAEGTIGANGGTPLAHLEITNGYFGKYDATVGGINGKTYRIAAEATNAAGEYFCGWRSNVSNELITTRVFNYTISATASGAITYEAVYGAQADSIYKNSDVVVFEDLTTGEIKAKNSDVGVSLNSYSRSPVVVTESLNGDKEIEIQKVKGISQSILYLANNNNTATSVEFDLTISDNLTSSSDTWFAITLKDGNTVESKDAVDLRSDLQCASVSGSYYIYFCVNGTARDKTARPQYYNENGVLTNNSFKYAEGQEVTVKIVVDAVNNELDYYLDGEFFGSIALAKFYAKTASGVQPYFASLVPSAADASSTEAGNIANAYISQLFLANNKSTADWAVIDNVIFD